MKAAKAGAIVNISSVSGLRNIPVQFAYAASKWAVRGMTGNAAAELAHLGIRVIRLSRPYQHCDAGRKF
jgi:3alpha(or 20beta)-hydroxysteroid dehydrogenase